VLILERYFAYKWFTALRKAFDIAYPGEEMPNRETLNLLVKKFRETGSMVSSKKFCREAVS
jgi:hypothetical protein